MALSNSKATAWSSAATAPSLRWKEGAISLADKYPDALESFFEFCYTGDYTLTKTGVTELEVAKNRYLLLVLILAVAEHYECEEQIAHVLQQIICIGDIVLSSVPLRSALFKFMVGVLYLHYGELDFPYEYDEQDANIGKIDTSKADDFDDKSLQAHNLFVMKRGWSRDHAVLISMVEKPRLDDMGRLWEVAYSGSGEADSGIRRMHCSLRSSRSSQGRG
jgi:hypothetical protein